MKQKDMIVIVMVVVVAGIFALVFSKFVISAPKNRQEKVEVVEAINQNFGEPSNKYFNDQSIDPTRVIKIGDTDNPQPFTKGH